MHRPHRLTGREVQLARWPDGELRAGDFRIAEAPVREPGPGEVLVRNTWTSVDPGLRLRLAERGPAGYFAPFGLREPMDGIMTIGEVVESRADGFAAGDAVWHASGWRDYAVVAAGTPALGGLGTLTRLDTRLAPAQRYLGPLGGMGLTAYAGLFGVAGLRVGDVVWVSAAAGAVGSLAAQFAKLGGHRVIGSAGSDEKVSYLLDELGLDAAFNHRAGTVAELLRAAAPEGIDVYFDCVGSDHLEAALGALRRGGRAALCGAVSQYGRAPSGPANLFQATANDLTLRGFRGSSHLHRMGEMQRAVAQWLAAGRLRYRETIVDGLERAPRGAGADAGRRHDRQDAGADQQLTFFAMRGPENAARDRAGAIASVVARPSEIACDALRGTRASPITWTVPVGGTSALSRGRTRSPTTITVSAATCSARPTVAAQDCAVLVDERSSAAKRTDVERRPAEDGRAVLAALRRQQAAERCGRRGHRDRLKPDRNAEPNGAWHTVTSRSGSSAQQQAVPAHALGEGVGRGGQRGARCPRSGREGTLAAPTAITTARRRQVLGATSSPQLQFDRFEPVRVEVEQRPPAAPIRSRGRDGELAADRLERVEEHDLAAPGQRHRALEARPGRPRRWRRARRPAPRRGAPPAARPGGALRPADRAPG